MSKKENILVSACLLGAHCRYDGKCQEIEGLDKKLELLLEEYNLVPFCPEIYGGLPTPRKPAEIKNGRVVNNLGEDVTDCFERGAKEALAMAQSFGCKKAVLKKRSPSCGSGIIYDGSFSKQLIPGDGVTAGLLKKYGIEVLDETQI